MSDEAKRERRVWAYVIALAMTGLSLVWCLIAVGASVRPQPGTWLAALLFSVLLFAGETQPRLWMRWGDQGEVTPGWAFAYALVLVGTPFGAVLVMVGTSLYVDLRNHKGPAKLLFNVSQATVSLSVGSLILVVFGVRSGIVGIEHLPFEQAIGIFFGGVATFVSNGVLTGIVVCLHQGFHPRVLLQRAYALSMAADGALLALAPVFVFAIQYSTLMFPLLGITSFLVYHSARNALRSEHAANHDPLTMLLNRRSFDELLAKAVEESSSGRHPLVLVMDLDRFKDINDRLGHPVGDRLLRSFAERLERVLPHQASASRLGGDEFAVLLPHVDSQSDAERLVGHWHEALSVPHEIVGFPVTSAVSVGAAIAPDHGHSAAALMAAADLAMYRAKQYRTGVEFATATDSVHDVGRVGLLSDLREAIGSPQISAHYQPLVRLEDGSVESVEALIRWCHPVHGMVPPSEFIGMTEQTDLIGPLTEMMFRNSMIDLLTLGSSIPRLSLNVAARSLVDRQFATTVLRIMGEVGFPADHLEIEIIERDIVSNSDRSLLTLSTLRAAGVRIAIDDFGTGYASLLTLRNLHADRLKIDQQFTSSMLTSATDELIVTKLIEIAHRLGLDVVAEGVESYAVWERLAMMGCDVAQGYAIARPMPLDELRAWLTRSTRPIAPSAAVRSTTTPRKFEVLLP